MLIKPYYRNSKEENVKTISDKIQQYVIESDGNSKDLSKAFQVTVDNNVCVAIYNENGHLIYDADSLGSGCVFHAPLKATEGSDVNFKDGLDLQNQFEKTQDSLNINVTNTLTNQEMIVYGRKIKADLANYYLYVNSPLEPVGSIISFLSQQYLFYTIIVMIIASIISIFISNRLTRPIVDMKKEADKLAAADYSVTFDGGYFSETKELASTLNNATKKLSKIDELRKDLIANISHDIKTPLTSIKAYAEMIRDISGDNKAMRDKHLDVIMKEADYLDHLVVDMSELSRMQSGNYVLNWCNFDLVTVIKEVLDLDEQMIKESKLHVETELPESLYVFADPIKIKQCIYNYMSNAIKHTPAGKKVTIRAYRMDDEETVRLEVEDEGEGIGEKDLKYIWDRYHKSSRSFSRSMTSTGLGLAIVKAILDAHHAEYGVNSEMNVGSLFYFELKQPNEVEEIEDDSY